MYKIFSLLLFIMLLNNKNCCASSFDYLIPNIDIQRSIVNPKHVTESLLYSIVRIEADKKDSTGVSTGFFYKFGLKDEPDLGLVALITNKHSILGASKGRFKVHLKDESANPSGNTRDIDFCGEDSWIKHPSADIDLCALPVGGILNRFQDIYITNLDKNILLSQRDLDTLKAVEEILMVGYPAGIYDQTHNYPIWRKGITSSHPAIDFNSKPQFLIDAACFPGSSGSPVFLYNEFGYSTGGNHYLRSRLFFLGILHAGPQIEFEGKIVVKNIPTEHMPISQTNLMINLGYVIKARELDGIRLKLEEHYNLKLAEINYVPSETLGLPSESLSASFSSSSPKTIPLEYKSSTPIVREGSLMAEHSNINTKSISSYKELIEIMKIPVQDKNLKDNSDFSSYFSANTPTLDKLDEKSESLSPSELYNKALEEEIENPEHCRLLLHHAVLKKEPCALYELSTAYLYGEPRAFRQDIQLAKKLCQEAASLGHEEAQVKIASALLYGIYDEKDIERGKQELQSFAEAHPSNQFAQEAWNYIKETPPEILQEVLDN